MKKSKKIIINMLAVMLIFVGVVGSVTTGDISSKALPLEKAYAEEISEDDITYEITYDGNGGFVFLEYDVNDNPSYISSESYMIASGTAIPLRSARRDDFIFLGWFTSKTGGTKVTEGTKVTKDMTLYAHWKRQYYSVDFDANGGYFYDGNSYLSKSKTKQIINKKITLHQEPAKSRGYFFTGWFTSRTGGTEVTKNTKIKVTKDMTLYAHWAKFNYKLPSNIVNNPKYREYILARLLEYRERKQPFLFLTRFDSFININVVELKISSRMNKKTKTKITNLTSFKNMEIKSVKVTKKYRKYVKIKPIKNGLIITVKTTKKTLRYSNGNPRFINCKVIFENGHKEYGTVWLNREYKRS